MANYLAGETSPYLLQHLDNPVDWYPWGAAALAAARERDVPILLSVGYSTCHWCHVMAHQSFADEKVAAALNAAFVCIKVDREERPDVDDRFMTAVQLLTGAGGWPLTVLLTPDLQPFYGATYLPPQHVLALAKQVSDLWQTERGQVLRTAAHLTTALDRHQAERPVAGTADTAAVQTAIEQCLEDQDGVNGGHRGAPRFPQDMLDRALLSAWHRTGRRELLDAARASLDGMAAGGIRDHLAGGFHRYSVDGTWTVPHFEKMLYNQAGLLHSFAQAAAVTGDAAYRCAATSIVEFVANELTDPASGAFWSALDADSEGEEGRFYLWSAAELRQVAGADWPVLTAALELADSDGALGWDAAAAVGVLRRPRHSAAGDAADPRWPQLRARILAHRATRPRPMTDDKVITAWNGLMIDALATAGWWLGEPDWVAMAARAAHWVSAHVRDGAGDLQRIARAGQTRQPAMLDDYAALGLGWLSLWRATGEESWRAQAAALADAMLARFDKDAGLLRGAPPDPVAALPAAHPLVDSALPSGNALAAELLTGLADVGETRFGDRGDQLLALLGGQAVRGPQAYPQSLRVALERSDGLASARRVRFAVRRLDSKTAELTVAVEPGWEVSNELVLATETGADLYRGPIYSERRATVQFSSTMAQRGVALSVDMQVCVAGDAGRCLRPSRLWLLCP